MLFALVSEQLASDEYLPTSTINIWRRKWQPSPVFLPGESQGWGSLVGCRLWGRTESHTTEATQLQQQYQYISFILLHQNFLSHYVQIYLTSVNSDIQSSLIITLRFSIQTIACFIIADIFGFISNISCYTLHLSSLDLCFLSLRLAFFRINFFFYAFISPLFQLGSYIVCSYSPSDYPRNFNRKIYVVKPRIYQYINLLSNNTGTFEIFSKTTIHY